MTRCEVASCNDSCGVFSWIAVRLLLSSIRITANATLALVLLVLCLNCAEIRYLHMNSKQGYTYLNATAVKGHMIVVDRYLAEVHVVFA